MNNKFKYKDRKDFERYKYIAEYFFSNPERVSANINNLYEVRYRVDRLQNIPELKVKCYDLSNKITKFISNIRLNDLTEGFIRL